MHALSYYDDGVIPHGIGIASQSNWEQNKKQRKSEDMIEGTIIINMNTKHKGKC